MDNFQDTSRESADRFDFCGTQLVDGDMGASELLGDDQLTTDPQVLIDEHQSSFDCTFGQDQLTVDPQVLIDQQNLSFDCILGYHQLIVDPLDQLHAQIPGQPVHSFPHWFSDLPPELPTGLLPDPGFDSSVDASYNGGTSFCTGTTESGPSELASGMPFLGGAMASAETSEWTNRGLFKLDLPATSLTSSFDMPGEAPHTGIFENSASRLGVGSGSHDVDNVPDGVANDQTESKTTEVLKCTWPGCRSKKTFKRKPDYNRHMNKHTGTVTLPCPVVYCPRQVSRFFYRVDKLRDHLRTGHTEDEICRCHVDGCVAPQMPLSLLRPHASYHRIDINKHPSLATSLDFLQAFRPSLMGWKCDLKKCKRWFGTSRPSNLQGLSLLREHPPQHRLEDRHAQSDVIRRMGYDPSTADIICPLCEQHFADSMRFVQHLETEHLTMDSAHYLSFKGQFSADSLTAPRYLWKGWVTDESVPENRYCHYCGDHASSNPWTVDHHLGLLTMSDEIRVARARILRLLPTFAKHPVFEADKPTVHGWR